jgi:hypothetical protein
MFRRTALLALGLCALAGSAVTAPASAAEAHGATVNIWYRLEAWPCGGGCSGGYLGGNWVNVTATGLTGGPSAHWHSFYDTGSWFSVTTTNCAVDSVSAHLNALSGSNPGTLDLSLTRTGVLMSESVLTGTARFTSASGVGSGTYQVVVPVLGGLDADTANACLAGPRSDASWQGTGVMAHARV